MSLLYRSVRALLARGCTVRQVLHCSLPAELVDGPDGVAIRTLAGLVSPYVGSLALIKAVEDAAVDLKTPPRRGATTRSVDDAPAGRRRGNKTR